MKKLDGKHALVIGGSKGIGKSIVECFQKEGATVTSTFNKTNVPHQNIKALPLDITRLDSFEKFFEELNPPPDIFVINAFPPPHFSPTSVLDAHSYDAMFSAVKGTFFLLQRAADILPDHARIVVVSSGATVNPQIGNGAYAGAKAAIEKFCLSLSKELGARKITVNCVAPGFTRTEDFNMPDEMADQIIRQTPLGRLGESVDVAAAIVALTYPENHWINGQIIHVNGGVF